jgi:hypothetical protein
MGSRLNPRCLIEPLQKLKNRKAKADRRDDGQGAELLLHCFDSIL